MVMYKIEAVKKSRNRKIAIIIIIIAIALICLAAFGGIKFAQYEISKRNQNDVIQNNSINNQNKYNNQENNTIQDNSITNNNSNTENNINNISTNGQNDTEVPTENEPIKNNKALTSSQINAINNIYKSNTKRVFLTFDDGPSSTVTPDILDTLKKENIKATFFVLGTMVKSNPEVIKRERQEGHYIANHGYSHVYKKVYEDKNKPLEEYQKTNELIQKALGDNTYQSNVFRFPGGSVGGYYANIKAKAKIVLKENNIAYLDWNALTNDSAGATTEDEMMKSLKSTSKGKNSIVVLMHDAPNKKATAKVLPKIIEYYRNNGYTFQNLYDII